MNSTNKLLTVSLICLGLSGSLVAYLWFYLEDRGSKLQADLQTVHDRDELEREYKRLQELLEKTATERAELENYVVSGENGTVAFLSLMDEIAAELGIELSTDELKVETTDEPGFDELFVRFSFKGQESQITRLVTIFETLPYHSRLRALELLRTYNADSGSWLMGGSATLELSIRET